MDKAFYLFCLTRAGARSIPKGMGVDGLFPVFIEPCRDIAAVVSEVDPTNFCGPEAEEKMKDIAWLGTRACRHEEVIREIVVESPVMPVPFGTIFSSLDTLKVSVRQYRKLIVEFLEDVDGKEEWSVKVFLDREKARKEHLKCRLVENAIQLAGLAPGKRYFQEQRIKASAEKEIDIWLKATEENLIDEIGRHAALHCERRLLSRKATGAEFEMIFNWAFLVHRTAVKEFHNSLAAANDTHDCRGLLFEISGPWPAYSFTPSLTMESEQ